MIGLREELELDRLRIDGIDDRGVDRRRLGVDMRLRGEGIVRCGAERGAVGGAGRL